MIRSRYFLSTMFAAGLFGACMTVTGCNGCNSSSAPIVDDSAASNPNGADPALANMASGSSGGTQVLGQTESYAPQQTSESYAQQPAAPIVNGSDYAYNQADPNQTYDSGYQQGEADQSAVDTTEAPPPLPEYSQPPAPGPDYYWTPGYWGWASTGYYWVPGTWVEPPYYGALWTPPYWGWYGNRYYFHHGYWGHHVGFYGGVDYGFGYVGFGFFGGFWRGHDFYYNRAVTNVGPRITNVYNRTVVVNNVHYGAQPVNRVSYNGGRGGIAVAPRPAEVAAMHEAHTAPVAAQRQYREQAMNNRAQFFNQNHGHPQQTAFAPANGQPAHLSEAPAVTNRGGFNPGAQPQRPNEVQRPNAGAVDQRNLQMQQHNNEMQQRNTEIQQRNNEIQQRNNETQQRNMQQQQQQHMQEQQRQEQQHQSQPMRGAPQPQPPHNEQPRQMTPPQQAPRPQPMQQAPRQEAPRAAPQPAPRPAEAPHAAPAPAPHAAPAPAPHGGGGGEHPHGH